MDKTTKITISLKGFGLSYVSHIDEGIAGQIMALCLASQGGAKGAVGLTGATRQGGAQRESAAEYLNRHAPKRNPDKILTLAGYLKEAHSKDAFQQGEIKSLFRDAGELLPANLNRDFKWVVSNGWIAPDPSKKGSFYVTNTGFKVLTGGFPDDLVKRTKGKFSGRAKARKAKP
jgi:hypothetical protein